MFYSENIKGHMKFLKWKLMETVQVIYLDLELFRVYVGLSQVFSTFLEGNKLFVLGGRMSSDLSLAELWIFDTCKIYLLKFRNLSSQNEMGIPRESKFVIE